MKRARYDAIVVGSGAGGGAVTWQLCELGARVLLLEAGPRYDPLTDYALDQPGWEQRGFPEKKPAAQRHSFAPTQLLDNAFRDKLSSWNRVRGRYVSGEHRAIWAHNQVLGLGGTTLRYTGEAQRLHPAAMQMRSRFGVAADWPLSYGELQPYYQRVEELIGVAGPDGDAHRPRHRPLPLPAHPLCYSSALLQRAAARLGMKMVPNSRAALSQSYDGRPPCNYCGQCGRGCPRTDKGSSDVTFLRQASVARQCRIQTDCEVLKLEAGDDDRVHRVVYRDGQGELQGARAAAVVLAAGALETPRLLLNSAGKNAPDGLANESGEVGRHFLETVYWMSTGIHPQRLDSHRGLPADAVIWDYNAPDAIAGVIGGCRFSPGVLEADISGPLNTANRVAGGWGRQHRQAMEQSFGHLLGVAAIGETLPHPGAFIDLDPQEKDHHGMPLARIHTHLDDDASRRLAFMADTSRELLRATGVETLVEEYGSWDAFNGSHLMGGCRMGHDPDHSVVDAWGRSHRWRNLFIADTSVFPSSGGGEGPSLTASALAVRTAEHLVALAGRGEL